MGDAAETLSITEARLADLSLPKGGWPETARNDALARVRQDGLARTAR